MDMNTGSNYGHGTSTRVLWWTPGSTCRVHGRRCTLPVSTGCVNRPSHGQCEQTTRADVRCQQKALHDNAFCQHSQSTLMICSRPPILSTREDSPTRRHVFTDDKKIPVCGWLRGTAVERRSFLFFLILCGQLSSLLWTPALSVFESVQCATEGRFVTDELSLSCARPVADGWPLMW